MSYFYFPDDIKKKQSFIEIAHHAIKKEKYCIAYTYFEKNGTNCYHVREFWTDASAEKLAKSGFKKSNGFVDSLAFSCTPVFVKLENFNRADPTDEETAESLRNMLESDAINEFKKGFAKTAIPTLELKQIGMLIPVAIGLILGVFLLMGGMK